MAKAPDLNLTFAAYLPELALISSSLGSLAVDLLRMDQYRFATLMFEQYYQHPRMTKQYQV